MIPSRAPPWILKNLTRLGGGLIIDTTPTSACSSIYERNIVRLQDL